MADGNLELFVSRVRRLRSRLFHIHWKPDTMKALARSIIISTFLSIIAAFVCFGHAEAHTFKHHHHHHTHHAHFHRYHYRHRAWHRYRHWHHRTYAYRVRRYRVPRTSSDILATAERFVGDRNPTGFRGPWCKAFVNMVARKTGHFYNVSKRAIDGLRMGVRVRIPRPGDLGVMRGHITFFAGYGGRGFYGLGGNQGHHRVTVSSYPVYRVVAWVRLE